MTASVPQRRPVERAEIDRLLTERGASQAEFARHLGIPESAVSNLLSGRRAIKDIELPVAAAFLGIEIAELLRLLGITLQDAAA
jgi:transcriptional regulator with XRE-family HTH domain